MNKMSRPTGVWHSEFPNTESLILAQNERWRRGLGMQVERERHLRVASKVAHG